MSQLILQATPIGASDAKRYAITNLGTGQYWTGKQFDSDFRQARVYLQPSEACVDIQWILRQAHRDRQFKRFTVPVEIEVYGDAPPMLVLAQWLHRATLLHVRSDEFGNGPEDSLVLPVIHWGLIEELDKPFYELPPEAMEEEGDLP